MISNNIIIRKSTFDDCKNFTDWEQLEYVREFLSIDKGRSYEHVVREFINREKDSSIEQYTILLKTSNAPIGRIYLSHISKVSDSIDITSIYIGENDCLGKGYGREAMVLLLEYCFNTLNMERVTLDHYPNNVKAASLYLDLGLKYEGVMRNVAKKDNKYFDLHLMSILKEEYRNRIV